MKIRLYGTNYFINNTGGALYITGGLVVTNGTVEFTGNRALHGGALSLISSSQVCTGWMLGVYVQGGC